jgi:hypothetical protein
MAVSASSSRPCTRPCRWVSILFSVQVSTRACQRRLQKEQLEEDICSALKLGWCLHETNRRSTTVIGWQKEQSLAMKFNVGRICDLSCYLDTYLFCLILIRDSFRNISASIRNKRLTPEKIFYIRSSKGL